MNARERFQKVMDYESVNRIPVMALEPYEQTALERWRNEGYIPGFSPEDTLGMDRFTRVPVSFAPFPQYDHKVLFEDDETIIETERTYGSVVKRLKRAPSMYYGHLEHTVKNFEDWKRARERYDGGLATRLPVNMDCIAEQLNHSQNPVSLLVFPHFFRLGFYLMGMERFMLAFHDEPALIHDMFGFWTDFTLKLARPFLAKARVDCLILMEDLAYNNAPHVSPAVYKEFWLPYQDLLVKECKGHGVKTICLWTAGDIDVMMPMLLDHGINCIFPVERCSPNMDPVTLRKKYGRELRMGGGIPKDVLLQGKTAIDREIERLTPLIREGGFLPALDDMVSPEVSLDLYRYFIGRLHAIQL